MIEIKNLSKTYQTGTVTVRAIRRLDLKIEAGEFTAIVGPSGSGKTTLLNIMGGLDQASEGSVKINGRTLTDLSDNALIDYRLHHIGFVFQSYNLIPVLSALENVELLMLLQKRPAEERRTRAEELLTAVGLQEEMHRKPSALSGGQQQRVAVARALAAKPDFILADEPTANLDAESTANLMEIMLELNRKEGVTFVFSTHDQRVIDRARRVVQIEDGVIALDTTAATV